MTRFAALGWLSGIVLAAMWLVGCSRSPEPPDEPVVAEVGNTYITERHFMDGYLRHLARTGVQDSERERRFFLDGLVNKRLLTQHALDKGLYDRDAEPQAMERIRDKLLIDAYTSEVIYPDVEVTEADLRDMFVRMNTTIKARHLYSRTLEGAKALKARLDAGETFEALAREVFADTTLANSGGLVGTFGFDEMDPAFEDAAYAMEIGAISDPVRTEQGYSIIQVLDRFTTPLLTETEFNERRDRVEQFVRYRKRTLARTAHVQTLKDGLDIAYESSTFDKLLDHITGSRIMDDAENEEIGPSKLVEFGPPDDRETWTVDDFRKQAATTSPEQRAAVEDAQSLEQFIDGLVVRQTILTRAKDLDLDESKRFEEAYRQAREDWIYEQFRADYERSIRIPDDSVRAYFDRYGTEFTIPEKVRVWEILLPSKRQADSVRALADDRPFESLAGKYSIRPGASSVGGDMGYVTRAQLGLLGDRVFSALEDQVIGPVEIAGRYAILKVGDRMQSRQASYDEASADIEDRLRQKWERRALIDEIGSLKDYAGVKINWSVLYSAALSLDPEG